jgi:hypothetical protein
VSHQHHHHTLADDDNAWQVEAIAGVVRLTEAGTIAWTEEFRSVDMTTYEAKHGEYRLGLAWFEDCWEVMEEPTAGMLTFTNDQLHDIEVKIEGEEFARLHAAIKQREAAQKRERDVTARRGILDMFSAQDGL